MTCPLFDSSFLCVSTVCRHDGTNLFPIMTKRWLLQPEQGANTFFDIS
jgi:hypothetical protein